MLGQLRVALGHDDQTLGVSDASVLEVMNVRPRERGAARRHERNADQTGEQ
jgi:hypothetical protein